MTEKSFPLTQGVTYDEVPDEGLTVNIEADPAERVAIAQYLDIPGVEAMAASLTVTRWRGRGLAVRGTVEAKVVQTCVVTLEPVETGISEEVETFFAPDVAPRVAGETPETAEVADIDVEAMVNGRIDVGALVCEHLALGLDPYPRKEGVVFQEEGEDGEETGKIGAFAALAALPTDRDGS